MIHKHYSLRHADRVLKLVKRLLRPEKSDTAIECWSNCREQGYCLSNYDTGRALCFGQQRNSDALLVLPGETGEFHITTNMPEDPVWDRVRYFRDTDEGDAAAAEFIAAFLLKKAEIVSTKSL